MESRDVEEIERFLTAAGHASLYAYYTLSRESPPEDREAAIKRRRAWAQGQQSNPKFKSEALFLIKQNALLRRALVEEPDSFQGVLEGSAGSRHLEALTRFIRGSIVGGQLEAAAEAAIRTEGRRLELTDAAIAARVDDILNETGAARSQGDRDGEEDIAVGVDLYQILATESSASTSELEAAHRARYKWARNLNDIKRSQDELQALDRAWRVLKDPDRRAAYDAQRAQGARAASREAPLMGLPGPAPVSPRPPPPEPVPDAESVTVVRKPVAPGPPPPTGLHTVKPVFRVARGDGPGARPDLRIVREEDPPDPTASSPHLSPPPFLADDSAERSDPRGPPPPVNVGRTIGVGEGPQDLGRRAPRLQIVGPDVLRMRDGVTATIVVRNVGSGRMPGRASADATWIEVENPLLDPNLAEQVIRVRIKPGHLAWGSTRAALTIICEHGERKTVAVSVFRFPWLSVLGTVGGLAVAGAVFAGVFWFLTGHLGNDALLVVAVDPLADHAYINGKEIDSGSLIEYRGAPAQPLRLRIETDGFAAHEEIVSLSEGQRVERKVRLQLADPMNWAPARDADRAPMTEAAERVIHARDPMLAACYSAPAAPPEVEATYTVLVDPQGRARNVQVADATFMPAEGLPCLRREFRAMKFSKPTGDYGFIQTRFALRVPR